MQSSLELVCVSAEGREARRPQTTAASLHLCFAFHSLFSFYYCYYVLGVGGCPNSSLLGVVGFRWPQ